MAINKRMNVCLALALLLLLLVSVAVAAPVPRYPARQGLVTDNAAVLSTSLVKDIGTLNNRLQGNDLGQLAVVTVDFLDGATIEQYASGLRTTWGLDDKTSLLLLAVGEDQYLLDGSSLPISRQTQQKLLSAYLEEPFLRQDYDGALTAFLPALAAELSKARGKTVDTTGLFGLASTSTQQRSQAWTERPQATSAPTAAQRFTQEDEESGFSLGKVFLTVFLLMVIFGNSGRARRRGNPGGCGCGCAPFSSILAGLGLWKLWGGKRR